LQGADYLYTLFAKKKIPRVIPLAFDEKKDTVISDIGPAPREIQVYISSRENCLPARP